MTDGEQCRYGLNPKNNKDNKTKHMSKTVGQPPIVKWLLIFPFLIHWLMMKAGQVGD